jgi:hypothetical protein
MNIATIARAAVILSFAGAGFYGAFGISQMLARPQLSFFLVGFTAFLGFIVAVVPLWSAYLTYRRHYLTLALLWIGVATIAVYCLTSSFLRWLGIHELIFHTSSDTSGIPFVSLPLSIALLVLPFWVAAKFCKGAHSLASRHIPPSQQPLTTTLPS